MIFVKNLATKGRLLWLGGVYGKVFGLDLLGFSLVIRHSPSPPLLSPSPSPPPRVVHITDNSEYFFHLLLHHETGGACLYSNSMQL